MTVLLPTVIWILFVDFR